MPESLSPKAEPIKVTYSKAAIWRRVLAFVTDLFLLISLTGLTFAVVNTFLPDAPFYAEKIQKRNALQVDSKLYAEPGVDIVSYAKADASPFRNDVERKDYVSARLEEFYTVHQYCPATAKAEYESRKALATSEAGVPLFELVDGKLVEKNLNPAFFLDFYEKELKNYATGFLFQVDEYLETTRFIFLCTVVEIVVAATVFFFLFYLVIPLWVFPKGRKTLGRAVFGIGILNKKALVPTRKNYALRALFEYGVFLYLDFFGFLIPIIVSTTMLFLSEKSQNLPDFVFGHYMVDVRGNEVYRDEGEYFAAKDPHGKSLLEDKDFEILQNHI